MKNKTLAIALLGFILSGCTSTPSIRIVSAESNANITSFYNNGTPITEVTGQTADFKFSVIPIDNYLILYLAIKSKTKFVFDPVKDAWLYSKPKTQKKTYKSIQASSEYELLRKFNSMQNIWFSSPSGTTIISYTDSSSGHNILSDLIEIHSFTPGADLSGKLFFAISSSELNYHHWKNRDFILRLKLGTQEFKIKLAPEQIFRQKHPEYIEE